MKDGELKDALELKGDKYSDNFLKLSRKQTYISKVLLVPWDMIVGYKSKEGTLYFACEHSDDFGLSGVEVRRVRCGRFKEFCHASFSGIPYCKMGVEDVTDWFVREYTDKGKCMFDDHSHEFVKINSHARKCKHCNKHEQREVRTIIKRQRKEIWS